MQETEPNLYIVGFMGTGKSTVGRSVAQRLHRTFLDSDHEIERLSGRKISEIFSAEGESAFRRMEREFIDGGHPPHGCIVACGGGLILADGLLEAIKARGVVICLHASLETIIERVSRQTNRPLLANGDVAAKATELFALREPVYMKAGTAVLTEGRSVSEIVQHVLRIYSREAREWARTHV